MAKMRPRNSFCTCGHLGDIRRDTPAEEVFSLSQHNGVVGHGACTVPGCPCKRFTWVRFNEEPDVQG